MVLNDAKEEHRVTFISAAAPIPRLTIQIWGKNENG
jgi:hypothetical protein